MAQLCCPINKDSDSSRDPAGRATSIFSVEEVAEGGVGRGEEEPPTSKIKNLGTELTASL